MSSSSLNARASTVVRNAISGYITLALSALLGFVATPILLSHLGDAGFGTWSLLLGLIGYVALLEAGIGSTTIALAAHAESTGSEDLSKLISTSLTMYLCAGAVGVLVVAGLALVLPSLLTIPATLHQSAQWALFLLGVSVAPTFATGALTSSLLGTGRMHIVMYTGFTVASLVTIGQTTLVVLHCGLPAMAACQLTGSLVLFTMSFLQVRRELPDIHVGYSSFDRTAARETLSQGRHNSVSSLAGLLAFGSDIVLVGLLLDARAAGAYAVALRGYNLLQRLTTGLAGPLGPAQAHAAAVGDEERLFSFLRVGIFGTLAIGVALALPVAAFSSDLLRLWVGSPPSHAAAVLTLLSALLVMQAPGLLAGSLLVNLRRARDLVRVTLPAAVANICLSVLFTKLWGVTGPAIGSICAVGIFEVGYLPRFVCHAFGRRYRDLLRSSALPLLVPTLSMTLVLTGSKVLGVHGPVVLPCAALAVLVFGLMTALSPTSHALLSTLRSARALDR